MVRVTSNEAFLVQKPRCLLIIFNTSCCGSEGTYGPASKPLYRFTDIMNNKKAVLSQGTTARCWALV